MGARVDAFRKAFRFVPGLRRFARGAGPQNHTRGGYDVLRIVLGILLLAAAGLKAHQLITDPPIGAGLLASPWFLWTAVVGELFLGAWLLCRIYSHLSRLVALAAFAVFAGVSLAKTLNHPPESQEVLFSRRAVMV